MNLVTMSPIVNKATKLWCLSVLNFVQNFLVDECKGVAPNQVCNEFLDWINTNDLSCMPFTGSFILGVMEGEGCIEFIKY